MARRLPGTAPVLSGYTLVHPLGTGGFADVFLYEQSVPRRRIAVKVLLVDAVPGDLHSAFLQETNTLAHLAGHPNVLTMYEAGISSDGRPYLVTEYCPDGYGTRFRSEHISVPEVLSVGLGVGAALHTAHVAGVLHRDVKPANVLITEFGRPVLSDFGIASTLLQVAGDHAPVTQLQDPSEVGLSIPWAPPEALQGQSSGSVASEIYSLGATLYALLTGRSPYETPEGPNDRMSLARRIMGRAKPLPIDRDDAPPALQALITECLQSLPANRPGTMLEVLHRLQLAESELGLRPTPLELARQDPSPVPEAAGPDGEAGTATGRLESLGASSTSGTKRRRRRSGTQPGDTTGRADDATRVRGSLQVTHGGARRWWLLATGAAVILAAAAMVLWWKPWATGPGAVTGLVADPGQGTVNFTWAAPSSGATDGYVVQVQGRAAETVSVNRYRVDTAESGQRVCLTVKALHNGDVGEPVGPVCARSGAAAETAEPTGGDSSEPLGTGDDEARP
ncbi:MAG: serine/threonine-protein kinase [Galactobacter sp.]